MCLHHLTSKIASHRTLATLRVTVLFLVLLWLALSTTQAAEIVTIEGCSVELHFALPSEFLPAVADSTQSQWINSNPARRAVFTTAFISRSLEIRSQFPAYIMPGTLGSALNHQGRISRQDFEGVKAELKRDNVLEDPRLQAYQESLRKGAEEAWLTSLPVGQTLILDVFEQNADSISLIGIVTMLENDFVIVMYSVARFDLVNGCLVFSQIALPTSLTLSAVKSILRRLVIY